ncbi:MAG: AEC family transporter [Lachnospirales bacterium]
MLEHFLVVLGQVTTLFLLMGIGFFLGKTGRLSLVGTGEMSFLLMYIVTPCIIVGSFQTDWEGDTLRTLAVGTAALAVCYGVYILISLLLFRDKPADLQAPLRFGCIYGNTGFMGLPLVRAVLGEEALIFAVVSMVVFNVLCWTHGVILMGGRGAFSPKKIVLNPGVIAVAIGLPLFLLRLRLPGPLYNAVGFVGDLNTPLAMVVIGAQMSRADLLSTFREKELYAASAVKLLLMPAVTALLLLRLHLDPLFYSATVILAAAPTAGITSMFAERFGRDSARAAQLVSLSTLLSILTLPVVGVAAQILGG